MFRFHTFAFAVAATLAACSTPARDSRPTVEARDDFGAPIALGRSPRRIVSLNPTTTELLFAIGASNRLVGRSQWDVFPDSAVAIPSVGQALRPNVEAIVNVRPDLVLLYASEDNRPAFDRLRQAGIATVALKIDSIAQFERDTRLIGRITGDSVRADALVDSVHATL
ncbi:MAG: ABC transporter substrate-binding protein, partial [bacterium]